MKFELVIFDLDGTVFDTRESVMNSVKGMIESENLKRLSEEEIKFFLGPPLEYSLNQIFGATGEDLSRLVAAYRKHYSEKEIFNTHLYDGMEDVFKTLKSKNIKIALATYKIEEAARKIFEHFNVDKYFDVMRGSVLGENLKKVDIMRNCMDYLNINDVDKILMVGDTENDFLAAIDLGCYYFGYTYGFGYKNLTDENLKYEKFLGFHDNAKDLLSVID